MQNVMNRIFLQTKVQRDMPSMVGLSPRTTPPVASDTTNHRANDYLNIIGSAYRSHFNELGTLEQHLRRTISHKSNFSAKDYPGS